MYNKGGVCRRGKNQEVLKMFDRDYCFASENVVSVSACCDDPEIALQIRKTNETWSCSSSGQSSCLLSSG